MLEVGVSKDGLHARISLDGEEVVTLGPAELEEAIWQLVAARAAMNPKRRPVLFPASRIVVADGWQMDGDGANARLCVHHPGLGWIGTAVAKQEVERITAAPSRPRLRTRRGRKAEARP
ncbi:hypothetical protein HMPREF9946_02141 [Acetobacteraceae bacterium AT-5844]|nr:hypothetical protein HMPREF9946_02141 [Acetobacteraceae bacterium AT-5844]